MALAIQCWYNTTERILFQFTGENSIDITKSVPEWPMMAPALPWAGWFRAERGYCITS